MASRRDLFLIHSAAAIRAFGIGLLGVLLGVYLSRVGLDATRIGFLLATGLAGATVATGFIAVAGHRFPARRTLCILALLSSVGGLGLAFLPPLPALAALVFVGMVNGMGTDRSASFALEQALIPGYICQGSRTWALSWYNVTLDASGAFGALAAAVPGAISKWQNIDLTLAYKYIFVAYTVLQLFTIVIYGHLPNKQHIAPVGVPDLQGTRISDETKSIIGRLAALFALDSFGGGFLGDALVTYWFFLRYGLDEKQLGLLFFVVHLLNAGSHLGAAWLAERIGLVNTMVFTHLPSSLLLIAVPFSPTASIAVVLFLLRESLVEMDVPTRQSYVAAIVKPHERTYASGVTNLTRTVAWAFASGAAGLLMTGVSLSSPLLFGGGLKILYDLLLYTRFKRRRAPEESVSRTAIRG
jgi:MFS family permease